MLNFPHFKIPIQEIQYKQCTVSIKREDLIHPDISGNKYWKLFYNVNQYLSDLPKSQEAFIITFGGAFSNHIASVAAFGKLYSIPTLGIIRGDELKNEISNNPTLNQAERNGMSFRFVNREDYRDKDRLSTALQLEFPNALIIPEGGTNELAVQGIQHMLTEETKDFNYLCTAVGTGGSISGISKYASDSQKVLGFLSVKDLSLSKKILTLSKRNNFCLLDASLGAYGKISDDLVDFINHFNHRYHIPLDPIYTGKMMKKIFELIDDGYFSSDDKILAFHTGGLQGIKGANLVLEKKKRQKIIFDTPIERFLENNLY
ncbi:1-aminocyclopropane-1-carboxylate deaminase/D-cysteine desulfhydrase [Elizabethkingia sp. JS20170427COW]|uniref:1-aminocyclopropane-1-carboxylate deaminase/D-cysteine desulfhydrase n=1 Tax=Elizabethkingia sp. JS20170427COW TaxID=2583851 RepID=UPI00111084A2|nr:pyridoxal-phosphate dependent enzyme [Elizabethkingia sp. JS20170427COW]QCX52604.1 pyridoxal-phosphate dependent enzyme [Elizabethkingia sp. JS20170427COW]